MNDEGHKRPFSSRSRDKKIVSFVLDPVNSPIGGEGRGGKDKLEFFQSAQFRFEGIKRVNGKTRSRDPKLGRTRQLSFQIIAQQCRRIIDNSQEIPQVTKKSVPHTLP